MSSPSRARHRTDCCASASSGDQRRGDRHARRPRPDARPKLTGRFAFATDIAGADALVGVTVRSDAVAGVVLGVDTSAARRVPGAVAVLTAADVPGRNRIGLRVHDQPVLAEGVIRHHGEPVAFVVARSAAAAHAMAAAVRVDIEPTVALLDPGRALDDDAPSVGPDGNLVRRLTIARGPGDRAAADDVVVRRRWETGRQDPGFLAPEAGLAVPDADGGVTLHVATQDVHHDRDQIAVALGLDRSLVRVVLAGVGGAFGGREDLTLQAHLCLAALHTGRPVRCCYSRAESFRAHPTRHPAVMDYALAASPDGRLRWLDAHLRFDGGAYASCSGSVVGVAGYFAAGPYRIDSVRVEAEAVYTNNPIAGAMRGFGATQACLGMESTMDALAVELGMHPVELRRRNVVREGDVLATSGQRLGPATSAAEVLEACAGAPLPGPGPMATSTRRGVGVALGLKGIALGDGRPEGASIRLERTPDGVEVHGAAAEVGQGVVGVMEAVLREHLGDEVPIRFLEARTSFPIAGVSAASRQTVVTAGAVDAACRALTAAGPGDTGVEVRYDTPATAAADPLTGTGDVHMGYLFVAHRAVVDVDVELGTVSLVQLLAAQDVGRAILPVEVEGQMIGGSLQGAGLALGEEVEVVDGRMVTASFSSYLVPTAADAPDIDTIVLECPEPDLPFGLKGMGEGPTISAAAAVAAAVRDATGAAVARVPIRPWDLVSP